MIFTDKLTFSKKKIKKTGQVTSINFFKNKQVLNNINIYKKIHLYIKNEKKSKIFICSLFIWI